MVSFEGSIAGKPDKPLTGYGGGLVREQWLLAHERAAGAALEA